MRRYGEFRSLEEKLPERKSLVREPVRTRHKQRSEERVKGREGGLRLRKRPSGLRGC
uniref:Uncharacterized protein n=1 Tax=Brassica campestris TaxID=3711 RepID=A0A3P6DHV0_BRACM|nr:unnamed protein product [Brassica rapa]